MKSIVQQYLRNKATVERTSSELARPNSASWLIEIVDKLGTAEDDELVTVEHDVR
jgi:hypothetical protein